MSYILEALKKSEQERGHGSAPGIQTVHSSSLNYQASKRSLWPWILITVVALNLAALAYFIFYKPPAAPVSAIQATNNTVDTDIASSAGQMPVKPAPEISPPQHATPDVRARVPKAAAPAVIKQNAEPRVAAADSSRTPATLSMQAVDIMQLPDHIRLQIPEMDFSAHVYSSNPLQRSVVINGRFMEEGENMNTDFVLREITSTGVIMDFRGHLFHTSVITGWSQ